MKSAGSVQSVILTGRSEGQLHSPQDFRAACTEKMSHGASLFPRKWNLSYFWRGWGGLGGGAENRSIKWHLYKIHLWTRGVLGVFFDMGHQEVNHKGPERLHFFVDQVWVLGPRANADTSERLGNKNGGRGSNNWARNDSLPVEVQGGTKLAMRVLELNENGRRCRVGPRTPFAFSQHACERGTNQQSCDRVL